MPIFTLMLKGTIFTLYKFRKKFCLTLSYSLAVSLDLAVFKPCFL
jgi:hypothetical protein